MDEKEDKKIIPQQEHKVRRKKKENFDTNLKNWKYIIATFSDLEIEVIEKYQEGKIEKYPGWFVAENHEFLQNTAGSGFS